MLLWTNGFLALKILHCPRFQELCFPLPKSHPFSFPTSLRALVAGAVNEGLPLRQRYRPAPAKAQPKGEDFCVSFAIHCHMFYVRLMGFTLLQVSIFFPSRTLRPNAVILGPPKLPEDKAKLPRGIGEVTSGLPSKSLLDFQAWQGWLASGYFWTWKDDQMLSSGGDQAHRSAILGQPGVSVRREKTRKCQATGQRWWPVAPFELMSFYWGYIYFWSILSAGFSRKTKPLDFLKGSKRVKEPIRLEEQKSSAKADQEVVIQIGNNTSEVQKSEWFLVKKSH